ncbi:MAG: hypothetical protein QOI51_2474 [Nocardioidaceae bacterium]|nr:hypothetical protein [Nocardioidaceae bacterium]
MRSWQQEEKVTEQHMTADRDDRPTTGDDRVDAVVARLGDLDGLGLEAQLDAFTEMHASLAAVLDTENIADDGSAPPPAS